MSLYDDSTGWLDKKPKFTWHNLVPTLIIIAFGTIVTSFCNWYFHVPAPGEPQATHADCPPPEKSFAEFFPEAEQSIVRQLDGFRHTPPDHASRSLASDTAILTPAGTEQFFRRRAETYRRLVSRTLQAYLAIDAGALDRVLAAELSGKATDLSTPLLHNVVVRHAETVQYDCQRQQFVYHLTVSYRLDEIFPVEIRQRVLRELRNLPDYRQVRSDPTAAQLNVNDLLQSLAANDAFVGDYCRLLQQHERRLQLFYPDIASGHCRLDFASGDYQLNPLQMLITQLIAQEYTDYARNHPRERFAVLVTGYADGQPIAKGGIPYRGDARWAPGGEPLAYATTPAGRSLDHQLFESNDGNQQLAYARAHNAATHLHWALQQLGPPAGQEPLPIFYQGIHLPTGTARAGDRRVAIQLQTLQKPTAS